MPQTRCDLGHGFRLAGIVAHSIAFRRKGMAMVQAKPEGWYTDPYDRHEARWMSDGRPTKLVRDGDAESYDDPPEGPFAHDPERIEPHPPQDGARDLRRADEAEAQQGPDRDVWMREMDAVWSDGAPNEVRYEDER
jgi:hypothetical protein